MFSWLFCKFCKHKIHVFGKFSKLNSVSLLTVFRKSEVLGTHGGEVVDCCLLGHDTV
jgi:hypothetical protein